ncbi:MAG: DUF1697 domain-containing protein [Alphaproteobacteria bacterium]|nr:DUF1697 domain-containing protein [Alphaproteobacteria bacterium]
MDGYHIVLIRGIGGATHHLVTMKALATAVMAAGIGEALSVLATGNFVVRSEQTPEAIAACFVDEMARRGLERPVVLRRPEQLQLVWSEGMGLPAMQERPDRVLVHVFDGSLPHTAVPLIAARATVEQALVVGGELVIDFSTQVSQSPLKLAFMEKCVGAVGTARNWNTLGKILAGARTLGWVPGDGTETEAARR